jgi:hypothetical protein
MDVHKDTIVVAVTAMGEVGNGTLYGTIPNTPAALEKLVKRLHQAGGGRLKFCYEAGPCGYGCTAPSPGWVKTAWWLHRR